MNRRARVSMLWASWCSWDHSIKSSMTFIASFLRFGSSCIVGYARSVSLFPLRSLSLNPPILEGYSCTFGGLLVSPGVQVLIFLQYLDDQLLAQTGSMILATLAGDHRID